MHARSVAGFIVVFVLMNVVVKRPFVAGLVHQMTDFILLALLEPLNWRLSLCLRQSLATILPSSSIGAVNR